MPWCPTCDRFLSPPTVTPDGRCPTCGRAVESGRSRPPATAERDADRRLGETPPGEDELPVPAHLKVLAVALVVYLGWRFIQGVEWVIHRF